MTTIRTIVVDDNRGLRDEIRACFSKKPNMEIVAEACDGVDALEKIERLHPDIVLLDIIMPRLDGFGVLDAMADWKDRPRVIVMTAVHGDGVVQRAIEHGVDYYMVKPMDLNSLYERILEVVGGATPSESSGPAEKNGPFTRWTPEERVSNLFLSIGIPAHIKGYQYLREAVRMVVEDHGLINRITKELYPGVAKRFSTTASKVERAMRHAIEVAWNRNRIEKTNELIGYSVFSPKDKPTNGEFIALVADKVQ